MNVQLMTKHTAILLLLPFTAISLYSSSLSFPDYLEPGARYREYTLRLREKNAWRVTDPKGAEPKLLAAMRPLVARFLELCERFTVDRASEHTAFSVDRERLGRLLAAEAGGEKAK